MNQPTVIPNQCILRIWNAILHYKKYSMHKLSSPCSTGDYRKMGQFSQISDYITLLPRPSRHCFVSFRNIRHIRFEGRFLRGHKKLMTTQKMYSFSTCRLHDTITNSCWRSGVHLVMGGSALFHAASTQHWD